MKSLIGIFLGLALSGCSPKTSSDDASTQSAQQTLAGPSQAMRVHLLHIKQAMMQKRLARLARRHQADMHKIRQLREDLEYDADYVGQLTFVVDRLIDSVEKMREKAAPMPGIAQGPQDRQGQLPGPALPQDKIKKKKVLESVA